MSNNNLPAKVNEIPNETIKAILKDAQDHTQYGKISRDGGFVVDDQPLSEITGYIIDIDPYWCKFEAGYPDKIHADDSPGEDYHRRGDIKIVTIDGYIIIISLPPTSYFRLTGLVRSLTVQGLDISNEVLTLTTKETVGKFGSFQVIIFTRRLAGEHVTVEDVPF